MTQQLPCSPSATCSDRRAVLGARAATSIVSAHPELTINHVESLEAFVLWLQAAAGVPFDFIQKQLRQTCAQCGRTGPSPDILWMDLTQMLHHIVRSDVRSVSLKLKPIENGTKLEVELAVPNGEFLPVTLDRATIKKLMRGHAEQAMSVLRDLRDHVAHHDPKKAWNYGVPSGDVDQWDLLLGHLKGKP